MAGSRFGTSSKFGTSTKFGATSARARRVTFGLQIDWDGDGVFDGYNEATGRLIRWNERRGREFFFNSGGDGFQSVQEGELKLVLKNEDRRYDPYYVEGALFLALQKHPRCYFTIKDETTGTTYNDFFGYVVDVRPHYGMMDSAEIIIKDGVQLLKDDNLSSSTVYSTVQYDAQIIEALRLSGYPDGANIDTTLSDTMTYHWFGGSSVFSEIMSLVDATFGLFFVAKDGRATYKSRISSDTSVQEITEADIDYNYGIQAPSPREVIKNVIKVYARARTSQTSVELWRMADKPLLASSSTGSAIWANYSYNGEEVPATSVTEPVVTTDYTAFANVDGTGTNYSANISWARTGFSTSSKLIPTNSGPAAYLTLMKLRGTGITADKYTFSSVEDTTSINTYMRRELIIKSDWLQDLNTAEEQANLLLDRFSSLRFFPRIKIKRGNLAKQLTPELFDLCSINFTSKSITGEMRIGYIERSWSVEEENVIDTIFYFEPNMTVSSEGAWVFPVTLPATIG